MSELTYSDLHNTNPVYKRIVVKAKCYLQTPALIGSGYEGNTDNDIIRYANGNPYLPGTVTAGVLRSLCKGPYDRVKVLFGEKDNLSPLWVYDTEFSKGDVIELDSVKLKRDNKVADDGSKFDFEAVNAGVKFDLCFLLTIRKNDISKDYEQLLEELAGILKSGFVSVGAKTKRGFGQIKCETVKKRVFDFTTDNEHKIDELNAWVNFNGEDCDEKDWDDITGTKYISDCSVIKATMKLDGSIMIRDTRNVYEDLEKDATAPDYKHISVNKRQVILGTSWAGAFRSGLTRLLSQKYPDYTETYINEVFGNVEEEKDGEERKDGKATVSKIVFCASFLKKIDGEENVNGYRSITRVKIDRFTGGAANGALFTEKPWFGGKATLVIRFPKGRDDIKELVLLGLDAIDRGLIQIGGEASVGRGFFKVLDVEVDDAQVDVTEPKLKLVERLESISEGKQ